MCFCDEFLIKVIYKIAGNFIIKIKEIEHYDFQD